MRIGLISFTTLMMVLFLIILNASEVPSEKIDSIFEDLDQNKFSDINVSSDANLSKFLRYSVQGLGKEMHGMYYFASWLNTHLPTWLTANKELFTMLGILVMMAPVLGVSLNYIILLILALGIVIWDKVKKKRKLASENG